MNRCKNKWLFAAAILVAVGAVIFVGTFAAVGFDVTRLSTQTLQTNTYEFHDDFEKILVNVETAAVTFVPSEENVCRVVCIEEEKATHSVKIQDDTLTISAMSSRKWYDNIGISFQAPTVTVYLPMNWYPSLSVTTATGDVELPDRFRFETIAIAGTTSNISCFASGTKSIALSTTTGEIVLDSAQTESVALSSATGKITASDVACNKLTAKSSTGRINLQNVIAEESIKVENSTGGAAFEGCDAADVSVKTSTGSVAGTFLSEKTFVTDTATGRIRVPESTGGGRCEITTSTGDIEIEICP